MRELPAGGDGQGFFQSLQQEVGGGWIAVFQIVRKDQQFLFGFVIIKFQVCPAEGKSYICLL